MGIMVAEWFRRRGRVILLVICIVAIFAAPALEPRPDHPTSSPTTRSLSMKRLNLSALRNVTTNNP